MPIYPVIKFSGFSDDAKNTVVVLVNQKSDKEAVVSAQTHGLVSNGFLSKFIETSGFKGKFGTSASTYLIGEQPERVIVLGAGDAASLKNDDWLKLGGVAYAAIVKSDQDVTAKVILAVEGDEITAEQAADFALGMQLRAYRFDKYQTKKSDQDGNRDQAGMDVVIEVKEPGAAEAAFSDLSELGKGVVLARDLVNEPANILGTLEFTEEAKKLEQLGVKVTILDEPAMQELGMGALLGVAQGSVRPPRLVVMEWSGGKDGDQPVAFVGKGVVFDTGGISIKPASNMEDMKGDMGGAAAVVGLMRALAGRKAKANIVGVIGLVENMPDGNAQRPGDIVTSMSGQTIEVINTDAEGRLVLADALYYTDKTFSPRFIINLATLTGAIMVALGTEYAGLFSNNDELSQQLSIAGESSGEKVWRMPLSKEYDKIVDSKFADMRNSCGRLAGAVTAAQFLQRFIGETPWAHLDIAGVAMDAGNNEYSRSWATGYGVRLLDQLVRNNYEA